MTTARQGDVTKGLTLENLIQEIVRTHDHNFPECSLAMKEFYSRALNQDPAVVPIWLHMLVRESKGVARAEEQKRIKGLIRKS